MISISVKNPASGCNCVPYDSILNDAMFGLVWWNWFCKLHHGENYTYHSDFSFGYTFSIYQCKCFLLLQLYWNNEYLSYKNISCNVIFWSKGVCPWCNMSYKFEFLFVFPISQLQQTSRIQKIILIISDIFCSNIMQKSLF